MLISDNNKDSNDDTDGDCDDNNGNSNDNNGDTTTTINTIAIYHLLPCVIINFVVIIVDIIIAQCSARALVKLPVPFTGHTVNSLI